MESYYDKKQYGVGHRPDKNVRQAVDEYLQNMAHSAFLMMAQTQGNTQVDEVDQAILDSFLMPPPSQPRKRYSDGPSIITLSSDQEKKVKGSHVLSRNVNVQKPQGIQKKEISRKKLSAAKPITENIKLSQIPSQNPGQGGMQVVPPSSSGNAVAGPSSGIKNVASQFNQVLSNLKDIPLSELLNDPFRYHEELKILLLEDYESDVFGMLNLNRVCDIKEQNLIIREIIDCLHHRKVTYNKASSIFEEVKRPNVTLPEFEDPWCFEEPPSSLPNLSTAELLKFLIKLKEKNITLDGNLSILIQWRDYFHKMDNNNAHQKFCVGASQQGQEEEGNYAGGDLLDLSHVDNVKHNKF